MPVLEHGAAKKVELPRIAPFEIEEVQGRQHRFAGDPLAPAAERLLQQSAAVISRW